MEPCDHPGCSSHVTHPCEECGQQWSMAPPQGKMEMVKKLLSHMDREMQTLISEALTDNGIQFSDLQSVAKDCMIESYPDKREIFSYRGRKLLEFHPIYHKTEYKDHSHFFTLERIYRKLY